jgi:hypothetical protein
LFLAGHFTLAIDCPACTKALGSIPSTAKKIFFGGDLFYIWHPINTYEFYALMYQLKICLAGHLWLTLVIQAT